MYTIDGCMGTVETASRHDHRPLTVRPAVDCGDSGSLLTLSPRQRSCESKQPVSHPLPVSSFEIKACSGSRPSATDPLHPNSNEINVRSGVAARTPFFVKKSKALQRHGEI